ncbi:MAG: AI-2E family transporter [Pseudomonadota bacterium]|nr:AI-2E family transporter [Pseudomonadota bacterium]
MRDLNKPSLIVLSSYLLAAVGLLVVLTKGLVAALFAGLLVYSLVHLVTPLLGKRISGERARMIAVAAIGALTVALLCLITWGSVTFFKSDAGSLPVLLQKMADIIEQSRSQIPVWISAHLPDSADALREMLTAWLREHAFEAKIIGQETGRTLAHILIGMIVGAMAALYDSTPQTYLPLGSALRDRLINLSDAFQRIVFAQVRIAAINATLVGIYLLVVLPLMGVHLPLSKSMIALTFFAGLLPVVGNLISNTVLVVVGLSHSLNVAIGSLVFMIVIHKLEYFLNAKIIGHHINARIWELLVAMLVMETLFGIPGVVAAPVVYAYAKKELRERGLV